KLPGQSVEERTLQPLMLPVGVSPVLLVEVEGADIAEASVVQLCRVFLEGDQEIGQAFHLEEIEHVAAVGTGGFHPVAGGNAAARPQDPDDLAEKRILVLDMQPAVLAEHQIEAAVGERKGARIVM